MENHQNMVEEIKELRHKIIFIGLILHIRNSYSLFKFLNFNPEVRQQG